MSLQDRSRSEPDPAKTAPVSGGGAPLIRGVDLLHHDASLLVCVKPAGLLAVPGRGEDKADCLVARLQQAWPEALTVHRLDMATSGLMVFARGAQAQRTLSMAFASRSVDKRYEAVVEGCLEGSGEIDLPLMADWPLRPRQKVDPSGKRALTRWRAVGAQAGGRTRVELEPVTGRSHQLRVHLLALGHPIVGDALYAPQLAGDAPRLLLHATRLAFDHPEQGRRMCFESPAPF